VRVADLYCCAGGASAGYVLAGHEVVGVDIRVQPNYPYEFFQHDVMDLSAAWLRRNFDAVHASPPCQGYSMTRTLPGPKRDVPLLIEPTRRLLLESGLPYVIENVVGAPLINPVMLCGTMFGLTASWKEWVVYLQRHRLFELSGMDVDDLACDHSIGVRAVTVAGHGRMGLRDNGADIFSGPGYQDLCNRIMDIGWMTRDELNESIPPAYTRYIGEAM